MFYLIHVLAVLEPESQIRGVVVIMDYNNLGMKQVKALSPSFSLLLLSFIQEAMPLRLKEVHIVRQPFIFNVVWNIFKPFIKAKLSGRVSEIVFASFYWIMGFIIVLQDLSQGTYWSKGPLGICENNYSFFDHQMMFSRRNNAESGIMCDSTTP